MHRGTERVVEPWLRGTLTELDPLRRGLIHALWLASEDVARWCKALAQEELEAMPLGLPPVGFQMRHMVRSLDRLLTYAEGRQLNERQRAALTTEMEGQSKEALFAEFEEGMASAEQRVKVFAPEEFGDGRGVGLKMLPSTLGGLLVHCADHTQRHAGQAVTTTKVVLAMRA
jgi:uncharacterized damage-inducible protein DinB